MPVDLSVIVELHLRKERHTHHRVDKEDKQNQESNIWECFERREESEKNSTHVFPLRNNLEDTSDSEEPQKANVGCTTTRSKINGPSNDNDKIQDVPPVFHIYGWVVRQYFEHTLNNEKAQKYHIASVQEALILCRHSLKLHEKLDCVGQNHCHDDTRNKPGFNEFDEAVLDSVDGLVLCNWIGLKNVVNALAIDFCKTCLLE
mmetsp:Transcript_8828/g.22781  ORF Transcript_8828/g.22781 Transcript_8828/m.22781 type:complete len:203 (-) Transcript_8828:2247-2855(-)